MIRKSAQEWEVGGNVNVGFLRDLIVVAKVPTPGDYAPDAYILSRGDAFYSFVPHKGIAKISPAAAREMVAGARRIESSRREAAAQTAASHIAAAKLRAELMA